MPMATMKIDKSEVCKAVEKYLLEKYNIKMLYDGSRFTEGYGMIINFEVKEKKQ